MDRHRFTGEIASTGTTRGHRIVVGRWVDSPFGAFTDLMHEAPDGVRTLYAPTAAIAGYVARVYVFDDVHVVPISSSRTAARLAVTAGPWRLSVAIGRRTMLGALLRPLPRGVVTAPWWCALVDPLARLLLRDVRTRGAAQTGTVEWYGAVDQRRLDGVVATLAGVDLGPMADVSPPVRFGFSSVPRRPGVVALTTTVHIAETSEALVSTGCPAARRGAGRVRPFGARRRRSGSVPGGYTSTT